MQADQEFLLTLVTYIKAQDEHDWCQRIKYGKCLVRKCLLAGGYSGVGPVTIDAATCPRWELDKAIEAAAGPMLAELKERFCERQGPIEQ